MPAPVIAGAAVASGRTVAGKIVGSSVRKTQQQRRKSYRDSDAIRHNRTERRDATARQEPVRAQRFQPNNVLRYRSARTPQRVQDSADLAKKASLIARMVSANTLLFVLLSCLYIVQAFGGILFLYGTYVDQSFWLDIFLPGEEAWQVGWGIGSFAVLIGLLAASLAYTGYRIPFLQGWGLIATLIVFTMAFLPFTLLIPWVFLWLVAVFLTNVTNTT